MKPLTKKELEKIKEKKKPNDKDNALDEISENVCEQTSHERIGDDDNACNGNTGIE